jgi:glc operon protein GlcG
MVMNRNLVWALSAFLATCMNFAHGADATAQKQVITLEGAKQLIATAVGEAQRMSAPGGAIAVVDDGGHLIAAERWDNTFAASATISLGKARTAALFRKPTKLFEDIVNKGRTSMTALPDSLFTPLQGGVPIEVDGKVIGAVGVSGAASAQQDEDIAMAAITAWKSKQ